MCAHPAGPRHGDLVSDTAHAAPPADLNGRPPVVAVSASREPQIMIRRETVDDLPALDTSA